MSLRRFVVRLRHHAVVVLTCGLVCSAIVVVLLSWCNTQNHSVEMQPRLVEPPDRAPGPDPPHKYSLTANLLIVVISAPANRETRNVIRQTWASNLPVGAVVRFVMGTKNLPEHDLKTIIEEDNLFSDVIILSDLEESYSTLTVKLLSTIEWVHHNIKCYFLMKVDEDSFVRVDKILYGLLDKPQSRLYWGFFDGRAHVKKSGKWQEKDFVLCDRYLPYALGGGYIVSKDLVEYLATNSKYLKLLKSEDVSLGMWLGPLDIHRVHDTNFDTEYRSRGCYNTYVVTHKKTPEEMRQMHDNLNSNNRLCSEEKRERLSYNYNWNELPTNCCKRVDPSVP